MRAPKEKCSKGHPMTPENTYLRRGTEQICRACQAEYRRQSQARQARREERGAVAAPARRPTTHERLGANCRVLPNGCWEWTGFIEEQGYGRTSYRGRRGTPAHQAMYDLLIGPVPDGHVLDHTCHTNDMTCAGGSSCPHRRCVNPWHLEPVTSEENSSRGVISRRTHCPHGHPYDAENTLVSSGRRYCRTCQRAQSLAQQAKKKARTAEGVQA